MTAVLGLLALGSGAAAAVNPCGVGLLPSYVAFLLGHPPPPDWRRGLAEGLAVGAAMTGGLVAVELATAAAFGAAAAALGAHLPQVGLAVGLATAAWGVGLILWPDRLLVHVPLPALAPQGGRGLAGAAAYGVAYGLASVGCTFPLFISLLVQASAAGSPLGAAILVVCYGLGMGAVVSALAVTARLAGGLAHRWVRGAARTAAWWVGPLVAASGLYVVAYWLGLFA